jgi:hypothetical protein
VDRLRQELARATQRIDELTVPASDPDEGSTGGERDRLEEEVRRLQELRSELHDGYRAFLLAALELLESSEPAARDAERSQAPDAEQGAG